MISVWLVVGGFIVAALYAWSPAGIKREKENQRNHVKQKIQGFKDRDKRLKEQKNSKSESGNSIWLYYAMWIVLFLAAIAYIASWFEVVKVLGPFGGIFLILYIIEVNKNY